jgi:hypothetical protein
MNLKEDNISRLVLKETAGCIWLFGLFFVVISLTVIIGLLGMFSNLNETSVLEKAAVLFISLAALAAGLWIIYINPVIYLCINKSENDITIKRRGFLRNEQEKFYLTKIAGINLVESNDTDGDTVYNIEIKLKDGKKRLITNSGPHNKEVLLATLNKIKNFL